MRTALITGAQPRHRRRHGDAGWPSAGGTWRSTTRATPTPRSSVVAEVQGARGDVLLACRPTWRTRRRCWRCSSAWTASLRPLGALVNNAGIVDVASARGRDHGGAPRAHVRHQRDRQHRLRARSGAPLSTRHGGPGGSIVNLSSAAARLGAPGQYVDYAASKGAIDTFTVGLAREVATEGVRVNAVRPGVIDTEIHAGRRRAGSRPPPRHPLIPMQRPGTAREIATGDRLADVRRGELHHGFDHRRHRRTLGVRRADS